MGYFSAGSGGGGGGGGGEGVSDLPSGDIWIRGPGVAKGYYKNQQKTAEEFTADRWFKTGDIGRLNKNGTISIIDRKKNLVKPPHGEYIAPERLESIYKQCDLVESIMIIASSHHNPLIAFIKPSKRLLDLGSKNTMNWEEFVNSGEAEKIMVNELEKIWKSSRLKSIERISAVKLFPQEWTPENGWLTAAMKIRRQDLQKEHASLIQKIFQKLETN